MEWESSSLISEDVAEALIGTLYFEEVSATEFALLASWILRVIPTQTNSHEYT